MVPSELSARGPQEPAELLAHLAASLELLQIDYLVTGSMATIAYGEPRFTNDIDVVVALSADKIDAFCARFPTPEYYCPRHMVADAVRKKWQFNIIHPASGLKIDVIIATDSDFDRSRLSRGERIATADDTFVSFASPEDVILKKLVYYREGGSEKHLRDIAGVLKVQGDRVDRTYITAWADRLGVSAEWGLCAGDQKAR
jgi:hypothetical protein